MLSSGCTLYPVYSLAYSYYKSTIIANDNMVKQNIFIKLSNLSNLEDKGREYRQLDILKYHTLRAFTLAIRGLSSTTIHTNCWKPSLYVRTGRSERSSNVGQGPGNRGEMLWGTYIQLGHLPELEDSSPC